MPGSHRQRNRAKHILKCHTVAPGMWAISGGRDPHIVTQVDQENFHCDCNVFSQSGFCSHIIKVQMELGQFPSGPILVSI